MKNYLYLICPLGGDAIAGPCKVGISKNPAKRLRALQTAWPDKLVIYEMWDFEDRAFVMQAEGLAHAALAKFRMNGEWFNIPPAEAMARITLWFKWSAEASALEDEEPLPAIPPQGVGLVANGMADRAGNIIH